MNKPIRISLSSALLDELKRRSRRSGHSIDVHARRILEGREPSLKDGASVEHALVWWRDVLVAGRMAWGPWPKDVTARDLHHQYSVWCDQRSEPVATSKIGLVRNVLKPWLESRTTISGVKVRRILPLEEARKKYEEMIGALGPTDAVPVTDAVVVPDDDGEVQPPNEHDLLLDQMRFAVIDELEALSGISEEAGGDDATFTELLTATGATDSVLREVLDRLLVQELITEDAAGLIRWASKG